MTVWERIKQLLRIKPKPAPVAVPAPVARAPFEGSSLFVPEDLPWIEVAKRFLGTKEIVGKKHNGLIVNFWATGKAGSYKDDETAWCSAFVSAVLEESHINSARTGWARNYLKWGHPVSGPAVGSVVVFSRGTGGHVGFIIGRNKDNHLMVLGGNQENSVSIAPFDTDRVLGYRWPFGHDLPKATGKASLPVIASNGKLSTNEA